MTSNFAARIADAAARFAGETAIEVLRGDQVETTTYGALMSHAANFAGWLHAQGIGPGDRAAILSDNDASWIAAYLGLLRLGAVAVPLDTAYKAAQVATVVADSGAKVLFVSPRYLETARAAAGEAGAASPRLALLSGRAPGVAGATEISSAPSPPPMANVAPEAAAVILYTSGTTADPKGVVLTHANLEAERSAALSIVRVTDDDCVLGVLPLFHALAQMANLLLPLAVGARVVFLETVSSTTLLGALTSRGVTIFACVPQFFYLIHQRVSAEVARGGALRKMVFRTLVNANVQLRDRLGWNPGRLVFAKVHRVLGERMRVLVTGGSRFDAAIGRDLYGMGFTVLNAYGLTETSGGATIVRPGDRFTTSVGQAFPGVDLRIADRALATDPAASDDEGLDGEILIRGPIIMREYFGRPDATAESLKDGWLHTGDLGRLDARGRLFITGRKKEIIVLASGKNLYPEEIEAHYRQAPIVKELCVLGLARPGEPSAERLHAVIVPDEEAMRDRGVVNLRELVRFELEGRSVLLPSHKRILSYDISLEPLPRTTTGKIRRHEVERRVLSQEAAAKESAAPHTLSESEQAWLASTERADLIGAIAAKLGREEVAPDANLELDLGLDSLERVELITLLEQRRGTRVPPDVRQTIFSARQMVDAVIAAPVVAPGATPAAGTDGATDGGQEWDVVLGEPPAPDLLADLAPPSIARSMALFVLIRVCGAMARVVLGVRVAGREHLPAQGAFLITPNHQTYFDGFFLAAALPFRTFRQIFFVGASEYFETPMRRRLARAMRIVPVDPDANLVSAMRAGAAGLERGRVLVLFPEGERSIDGAVKSFRKGAAILAAHLGVPVVPVAIDGLYRLWPRGRPFAWRRLLPGRAERVTITFGSPVEVTRGDYAAGTSRIRGAVTALFPAERSR